MTGPELIMWIMTISALATVINGGAALFKIGSNKKQSSDAEKILLRRVFEGTDTVRDTLNNYFNNLHLCLNEAMWSFFFAFVIFLFLLEGLASKIIVVVLFLVPLSALVVVRKEMHKAKIDFVNRLNDE